MSASSQIAALIALIAVNVCLGRISIRHARELTAAQLLSVFILGGRAQSSRAVGRRELS